MNNFGIKYSTKKKFRHFNEILSYKKSDVVIEVKSCGMCGSDNKIFNFGSNNKNTTQKKWVRNDKNDNIKV